MVPMKRCNQGWHMAPLSEFFGPKPGHIYQDCQRCRALYRGWSKKTLAEKLEARGLRKDPPPVGRLTWVRRSTNRKLGPIAVSISERGTCPPSCGFYDAGCYADYGFPGQKKSARSWDTNPWVYRIEFRRIPQ